MRFKLSIIPLACTIILSLAAAPPAKADSFPCLANMNNDCMWEQIFPLFTPGNLDAENFIKDRINSTKDNTLAKKYLSQFPPPRLKASDPRGAQAHQFYMQMEFAAGKTDTAMDRFNYIYAVTNEAPMGTALFMLQGAERLDDRERLLENHYKLRRDKKPPVGKAVVCSPGMALDTRRFAELATEYRAAGNIDKANEIANRLRRYWEDPQMGTYAHCFAESAKEHYATFLFYSLEVEAKNPASEKSQADFQAQFALADQNADIFDKKNHRTLENVAVTAQKNSRHDLLEWLANAALTKNKELFAQATTESVTSDRKLPLDTAFFYALAGKRAQAMALIAQKEPYGRYNAPFFEQDEITAKKNRLRAYSKIIAQTKDPDEAQFYTQQALVEMRNDGPFRAQIAAQQKIDEKLYSKSSFEDPPPNDTPEILEAYLTIALKAAERDTEEDKLIAAEVGKRLISLLDDCTLKNFMQKETVKQASFGTIYVFNNPDYSLQTIHAKVANLILELKGIKQANAWLSPRRSKENSIKLSAMGSAEKKYFRVVESPWPTRNINSAKITKDEAEEAIFDQDWKRVKKLLPALIENGTKNEQNKSYAHDIARLLLSQAQEDIYKSYLQLVLKTEDTELKRKIMRAAFYADYAGKVEVPGLLNTLWTSYKDIICDTPDKKYTKEKMLNCYISMTNAR